MSKHIEWEPKKDVLPEVLVSIKSVRQYKMTLRSKKKREINLARRINPLIRKTQLGVTDLERKNDRTCTEGLERAVLPAGSRRKTKVCTTSIFMN